MDEVNFKEYLENESFVTYLKRIVCDALNVFTIEKRCRNTEIVIARQLCHHLAKNYTRMSLAKIGLYFGEKNHATVINSIKSVNNMVETNFIFNDTYEIRTIFNDLKDKVIVWKDEERVYLIDRQFNEKEILENNDIDISQILMLKRESLILKDRLAEKSNIINDLNNTVNILNHRLSLEKEKRLFETSEELLVRYKKKLSERGIDISKMRIII